MTTATLSVPVSVDEAAILALVEARHQAHHDKDGAAIAAGYSSDAAVFSLAPPLAYCGVDPQEKQA